MKDRYSSIMNEFSFDQVAEISNEFRRVQALKNIKLSIRQHGLSKQDVIDLWEQVIIEDVMKS